MIVKMIRSNVFWGYLFGLSFIAFSSLLALYFFKFQFGGYDLSPIIDLSWRLRNGEIPGRDFISTFPPIIILLLKIDMFGQSSWFDLVFLNILAILLIYVLLGVFQEISDSLLLYGFLLPLVLCVPLVFTNHIWHSSLSQYLAIVFMVGIYSCLYNPNNLKYFLLFISSILIITAKQNIAVPFVLISILYVLLSSNINKSIIVLTVLFGAVFGIALLNYVFSIPSYSMIYSYYAVLGRGIPTKEMFYQILSGGSVFPLIFSVASLILLLGVKLDKNMLSMEYRPYFLFCALAAIIPILTDWDSKINNAPLLLFVLAYLFYSPVIGIYKEHCIYGRSLIFDYGIILLFIIIYLLSVLGGYSRERMKNVGPFYENLSQIEVRGGYFNGLLTGNKFVGILKEIEITRSRFLTNRIFFGPRIEFGYLLTKVRSPNGLPLWWHPGTSYSTEDEDVVLMNFINNDFDILFFAKLDRTRMPIKILNFIESNYHQLNNYRYVDVYIRNSTE